MTVAASEALVGRPLRQAERVIDVPRLNAAMNHAKDRVERAIRVEMIRATRVWLRSREWRRPRLAVTPAMRQPLRELHRLGREEARLELRRSGYIAHAALNPDPRVRGLQELFDTIAAGLPGIAIRIHADLVDADLADASTAAIARALFNVPGARDIASRVVSAALYSGMGQTFEEAGDLVAGWERTAILDAATCGPCDAGDGTRYATWAEAQVEMPNGGPAVDCDGGGRCRCRLVPTG